jgi:hypothetical protein
MIPGFTAEYSIAQRDYSIVNNTQIHSNQNFIIPATIFRWCEPDDGTGCRLCMFCTSSPDGGGCENYLDCT